VLSAARPSRRRFRGSPVSASAPAPSKIAALAPVWRAAVAEAGDTVASECAAANPPAVSPAPLLLRLAASLAVSSAGCNVLRPLRGLAKAADGAIAITLLPAAAPSLVVPAAVPARSQRLSLATASRSGLCWFHALPSSLPVNLFISVARLRALMAAALMALLASVSSLAALAEVGVAGGAPWPPPALEPTVAADVAEEELARR
jgi:hypothetical protein